jgi:vacuolar-type H+-ATPase subunit E/Vma4
MDNNNKTGNFLSAIKKYSEEERGKAVAEMEAKRTEAIEKAEKASAAKAEAYKKRELSRITAEITSEYAVKNLNAQGEVFKKRDEMVSEIFKSAKEKLRGFSHSDAYGDKLLCDAREIRQTVGERPCTVYLRAEDMNYAEEIKAIFGQEAEICEDKKIELGGIRCYCRELRLVADNTLDSKLEAQREWFSENADLRI